MSSGILPVSLSSLCLAPHVVNGTQYVLNTCMGIWREHLHESSEGFGLAQFYGHVMNRRQLLSTALTGRLGMPPFPLPAVTIDRRGGGGGEDVGSLSPVRGMGAGAVGGISAASSH